MSSLKLALTKVSWATEAKMELFNKLHSQYLESLDSLCLSLFLVNISS